MKRLALIAVSIVLLPTTAADEPTCEKLQRCVDFFQQSMCLRYGGLPRMYTEEERRMSALRYRMETMGCAVPEPEEFGEACEAVMLLRFGEADAAECGALAPVDP